MSGPHIKSIAIVGSTGNVGSHITRALSNSGTFSITAITRANSSSQPPAGLAVAKVNYDDDASLIAALKGHDALVITLGIQATLDTQKTLIRAAGEAGVPWIMPNEWTPDLSSEELRNDVHAFSQVYEIKEYIKTFGKSSYIALDNGFWYEWSLAIPDAYGFDIQKKQVTLFDQGETKICTSTWPQVGRAVAAILSLPLNSTTGPSLNKYRNSTVFTKSFTVSQRDMLASILRVTGDKETDWTIDTIPAHKRVAAAQQAVSKGDQRAYVHIMYTRVFYNDGNADFEKLGKLSNEALGLPREDIDEATAVAIERSKKPLW